MLEVLTENHSLVIIETITVIECVSQKVIEEAAEVDGGHVVYRYDDLLL